MIGGPILDLNAYPTHAQLAPLWLAAWGSPLAGDYAKILHRSLCHAVAWDDNGRQRLIGFVNVAWDGGVHAFLLDTTVHPDFQRRGIATELVRLVTTASRDLGAEWLHVDFAPHLEGFYRGCGFRATQAGLIQLH